MIERKYDISPDAMREAMELPAPYKTFAEVIDLMTFLARKNPDLDTSYTGTDQSLQTTAGDTVLSIRNMELLDGESEPINISELPKLSELSMDFDRSARKGVNLTTKTANIIMTRQIEGQPAITKVNIIDFDRDEPAILRPGKITADYETVTDNSRITVGELTAFLNTLKRQQFDEDVRKFIDAVIESAKARALNFVEATEKGEVLAREIERLQQDIKARTQRITLLETELREGAGVAIRRKEAEINQLRYELERSRCQSERLQREIRQHVQSIREQDDELRARDVQIHELNDANSALRQQLAQTSSTLQQETERADQAEAEVRDLDAKFMRKEVNKALIALAGVALGVTTTVMAGVLVRGCNNDDDPADDDTPALVANEDSGDEEATTPEPTPEPITPPEISPMEYSFENGVKGELVPITGDLPRGIEIEAIYLVRDTEDSGDSWVYASVFGNSEGFRGGRVLPRHLAVYKPGNNDKVAVRIRGGGTILFNWKADDRDDYPDDTVYYEIPLSPNREIAVTHNGVLQISASTDEKGRLTGAFVDELKSYQAYEDSEDIIIHTNMMWIEEVHGLKYNSNPSHQYPLKEFLKLIEQANANN